MFFHTGPTLSLLQYYVALALYLVLGGLVLHAIEKDKELDEIERGLQAVREANLTDHQIELLTQASICRFRTMEDREWTLSGSTFFSLTVVTTIGYGFIAPVTDFGRTFTLFYSLIGIGLVAHILQNCTKIVMDMLTNLWNRMCHKQEAAMTDEHSGRLTEQGKDKANVTFDAFDVDNSGSIDLEELGKFLEALSGKKVDPLIVNYVMHEADSDPNGVLDRSEMVQAVTVYYSLESEIPQSVQWRSVGVGALIMFVWLFFWAAAFGYQETWSWRDGFWYCYVTLTTIGFGDYHPRSNVGRFMAFLFVIPGLSIVGWFINIIFQASRAKRYWMLQKAYAAGSVSGRVLRSQGIRALYVAPEDMHKAELEVPSQDAPSLSGSLAGSMQQSMYEPATLQRSQNLEHPFLRIEHAGVTGQVSRPVSPEQRRSTSPYHPGRSAVGNGSLRTPPMHGHPEQLGSGGGAHGRGGGAHGQVRSSGSFSSVGGPSSSGGSGAHGQVSGRGRPHQPLTRGSSVRGTIRRLGSRQASVGSFAGSLAGRSRPGTPDNLPAPSPVRASEYASYENTAQMEGQTIV